MHHYHYENNPIKYLENQVTYTDILVAAGYQCALSGKWHLDDSMVPQHGFSKWYTIGAGGADYYHADVVEDGKLTMEHGKYLTDLITEKAIVYLEKLRHRQVDDGTPFYLSVHYTAPHAPSV